MKITLDLIENRNPCTISDLNRRTNKNLREQGLDDSSGEKDFGQFTHYTYHSTINEIISSVSGSKAFRLSFISEGKHPDISQLYSVITNAGYSIKKSKIDEKAIIK